MNPFDIDPDLDVREERRFMAYAYLRELESERLIRASMRAYFETLSKAFGGK
jgi:hypothetical protein